MLLNSKGATVVFEMIKIEDEKLRNLPLSLKTGKCDAVIIICSVSAAEKYNSNSNRNERYVDME